MSTIDKLRKAKQKNYNKNSEYLVDTNVLLWFAGNSDKLTSEVVSIISDISNKIYVSDVTLWEIVIKKKIGKLDFDLSLEEFTELISAYSFSWLSIRKSHIYETLNLPLHHRDPFDRLLIAQSKTEKLVMLTKDGEFQKYEIDVIW